MESKGALMASSCNWVPHVVKANGSDKMCSQIKYNLRILKSGQITRRQQQQQQQQLQHATTATFCRFLRSPLASKSNQ